MKKKYFLTILIIIAIICFGIFYYLTEYNTIDVKDVKITENGNDSYEVSFILISKVNFDLLDCGCSLFDVNGNYIGYGEYILENINQENNTLQVKCNASISDEILSNNTNVTPEKLKIIIYDELFNSDLKDERGNFKQKPVFSTTIDI